MKRLLWFACVLAVLNIACTACTRGEATSAPGETQRRIVSLMPSLTEDLFAIGAGPQVVGVSSFTTYPPQARRLPVVASFDSVAAERIVQLHPDLIVAIAAQNRLLAPLRNAGLSIVTFSDDTYDDIFRILEGLGVLTGHTERAQQLIQRLRTRTADLRKSAQFRRPIRCLAVVGVGPIFIAGNRSFIATLIGMAGGTNAASVSQPFAQYSPEAVSAADPDVIITDRPAGLSQVLDRPPWRDLRAVRLHRVFVEPDEFNVPGPRYTDSLAWLIARFKEAAG